MTDRATSSTEEVAKPPEDSWSEWVKDYYRHVESYDWVAVADRIRGPETFFHRNRARAVRKLVARHADQGRPMLDAGCGTGLNLRHLPPGTVGLDLNPRHLALVEERLPHHSAVLGDIEGMPFGDREFGTVVCTEVIEHVPDPARALAEIRRVLVPGGLLIGSVPARSPIWKLRSLSRTCPGGEPFHELYRVREVRSMLSGFDAIRVRRSTDRLNVFFVVRTR
jgi:SAM-dependent methyltransferase